MSFGGWGFLGEMTYRLRETAVFFMLNRMATPLDVTVFSLGSLGRRQIDTWMNVLAVPLYTVVTGMHALGAKERVRAIYLRGGRIALWILLLAVLPGAIYAEPIIRLYAGPEYLEAATVMASTLACLVAAGGSWMIWQVANATGKVRCTGLYTLVTQLSMVAATLYAVGVLRWGASGVALATFAVAVVTSFLLLWPLGLHLTDLTLQHWVRQTLIPGFVPGCAASVVWATLDIMVRPDSWTRLGLCALAGALCYLGILLWFCLEPRDREDLINILLRIRNRAGRYCSRHRQPEVVSSVRS